MTINEFLEASLAAAGDNLRKQRVKVCRAMMAFMGEEVSTRDLLELALPATIDDFSRFILESYIPTDRYSKPLEEPSEGIEAVRARRRMSLLTTLRAMLRDATLAGVFPAVDPFADIPELRRRQSMRLAVDPTRALGSMLKTRRADQRTMAGLYAVGLMLGGMPIEALLAAIEEVTTATTAVPLPHLGIEMPLTPMMRAHIIDTAERLSSSAFSVEELLGCLHAKQLLMSDSMMVDWTRFAAAAPLPGADIAAVISLYLHPEQGCGADRSAQQAALGRVAAAVGRLMPEPRERRQGAYWGVVVTGRQCTAQELYERLHSAADSLDPDDREIALAVKGRLYCPCRQSARRSRGEAATRRAPVDPRRSVLRRTLFVNATTATLTAIGRRHPEAWVLRHADSKRYVRIPAEQLDFMRSVLDTFGPTQADDIDILFDHGADAAVAPSLDAGHTVVLLHPDLAGQTATVVGPDPQRSTPTTTYYRVTFTTTAGLRFTLSLPSNLING